jgi:hypothetical protein
MLDYRLHPGLSMDTLLKKSAFFSQCWEGRSLSFSSLETEWRFDFQCRCQLAVPQLSQSPKDRFIRLVTTQSSSGDGSPDTNPVRTASAYPDRRNRINTIHTRINPTQMK